MKVVFLDVDGVLNNSSSSDYEFFDPKNIDMANTIVRESGAKICISSDWRIHDNIEDILYNEGVRGDVVGITCRAYYSIDDLALSRAHEIDLWLKHDHECKLAVPKHYARWPDGFETPESFVILDDTSLYVKGSGRGFAPRLDYIDERLVQTDPKVGLQLEDVPKALEILNTSFTLS